MKSSSTMLVLTLLLSVTPSIAHAQSDDKATIDKFIAAQAAREHGEEPDGVRKTVEGDLNRDGVADTAVLYTIEGQNGSNNYIQYLAVFLRRNGKLVFTAKQAVGGKTRREIGITSIANNAMLFDTTSYVPRDPACCPTIKGRTRFVLTGTKLVEKRAR